MIKKGKKSMEPSPTPPVKVASKLSLALKIALVGGAIGAAVLFVLFLSGDIGNGENSESLGGGGIESNGTPLKISDVLSGSLSVPAPSTIFVKGISGYTIVNFGTYNTGSQVFSDGDASPNDKALYFNFTGPHPAMTANLTVTSESVTKQVNLCIPSNTNATGHLYYFSVNGSAYTDMYLSPDKRVSWCS